MFRVTKLEKTVDGQHVTLAFVNYNGQIIDEIPSHIPLNTIDAILVADGKILARFPICTELYDTLREMFNSCKSGDENFVIDLVDLISNKSNLKYPHDQQNKPNGKIKKEEKISEELRLVDDTLNKFTKSNAVLLVNKFTTIEHNHMSKLFVMKKRLLKFQNDETFHNMGKINEVIGNSVTTRKHVEKLIIKYESEVVESEVKLVDTIVESEQELSLKQDLKNQKELYDLETGSFLQKIYEKEQRIIKLTSEIHDLVVTSEAQKVSNQIMQNAIMKELDNVTIVANNYHNNIINLSDDITALDDIVERNAEYIKLLEQEKKAIENDLDDFMKKVDYYVGEKTKDTQIIVTLQQLFDDETNRLKSNIQSLMLQVNDLDAENYGYNFEGQERENHIKFLETTERLLNDTCNEYKTSERLLNDTCIHYKQTVENLQNEISQLKSDNICLSDKYDNCDMSFLDLSYENEENVIIIGELQKELNNYKKAYTDIHYQNDKKEKLICELQHRISDLDFSVNQYRLGLDNSVSINTELNKNIQRADAKSLKVLLDVEDERKEFENFKKTAENQIITLEKDLDTTKISFNKNLQDKDDEIIKNQKKIFKLDDEYLRCQKMLITMTHIGNQEKNELTDIHKNFTQDLESKLIVEKEKVSMYIKSVETLDNKLLESQQTIINLEAELETEHKNVNNYMQLNEKLKMKVICREGDIQYHIHQAELQRSHTADRINSIEVLQLHLTEFDNCKKALQMKENNIIILNKQIEDLKDELDEVVASCCAPGQVLKLKNELEQLEFYHQETLVIKEVEYQETLNIQSNKFKLKEDEIVNVKRENDKKVISLENTLKYMDDVYQKDIAKLTKNSDIDIFDLNEHHNSIVKNLVNTIEQLQKDVIEKDESKEKLTVAITELVENVGTFKQEKELEISELYNKISILEKENNDLDMAISDWKLEEEDEM